MTWTSHLRVTGWWAQRHIVDMQYLNAAMSSCIRKMLKLLVRNLKRGFTVVREAHWQVH